MAVPVLHHRHDPGLVAALAGVLVRRYTILCCAWFYAWDLIFTSKDNIERRIWRYRSCSRDNYRRQGGGEATAFNAEVNLLHDHGYEVLEYFEDNHNIASRSQLSVALQIVL